MLSSLLVVANGNCAIGINFESQFGFPACIYKPDDKKTPRVLDQKAFRPCAPNIELIRTTGFGEQNVYSLGSAD